MDVTLLSTMISELITDHDMVGLPGLGTFVAEVVPATFSDKGYTINPPYRRLSFHPSRSEDTLLIDFYAASNGISKEAAALYLKQFLAEMKTVLKERKTIALPGLGRLRATVENNFFFVPDPDLDIYPDGFGLEPLSLKTITEPEPVEIPIVPSSPETVSAAVADTATAVVAETAPVTEEVPAAETISASAPDAEAYPVTVTTPATEATPAAETESATAATTVSEPQPQPVTQSVSEPHLQPKPQPTTEPQPRQTSSRRFRWWVPVLILLAVVAVALLAFLTVAQVAPDFIDSILYTPEELRIINY